MKVTMIFLSLLAFFGLGAAGYFLYNNNNMRAELTDRDEKITNLDQSVKNLQVVNDSLTADLETVSKEKGELFETCAKTDQQRLESETERKRTEALNKEKEAQLKKTTNAHDQLVSKLKNEIHNHQIQIKQFGENVTVSMQNKILFPSGQAELSAEGLAVLQKIGGVLKKVKDKKIRIEGHTDNIPITNKINYDSNWELSAARAINVVRFLTDKTQVPAELVEAVALSEFHPVADNTTTTGRSRNRRIEIMLQPMPIDQVEEPTTETQ